MDNIMLGVVRTSECANDVLIPKGISDELLGDLYADLTLVIYKMHPEAMKVATELLERVNNDKKYFINN